MTSKYIYEILKLGLWELKVYRSDTGLPSLGIATTQPKAPKYDELPIFKSIFVSNAKQEEAEIAKNEGNNMLKEGKIDLGIAKVKIWALHFLHGRYLFNT